jgi:hypothetical protein
MASTAYFLVDLVGGSQGKLKVVALDPADSSIVIESNEATYNGGIDGDYAPAILAAVYTHDDTRLTVHAVGTGLVAVATTALDAADGTWTFPLAVVQQDDSSLTATAITIAAVPQCVLSASLQDGRALEAPVAGESVTLPLAPLYTAEMLDPDPGFYPKDFAFVYTPGKFHCIYIRANRSIIPDSLNERAFGHQWTSDWVNWEHDASPADTTVLTTLDGSMWDDTHVWAPTIVQEGLTFYMFYTGVHDSSNGRRVQQIGLARSFDLSHWTRNGPPVYSVGAVPWADNNAGRELQFRDPFVMRDPTRPTGWVMYYVTTLANRLPQMVVGVAQSRTDTLGGQWDNLGLPLLVTDNAHTFGANKTESPHVFWDRGRWHMLFTTGSGHVVSIAMNGSVPVDTVATDSLHWSSMRFYYYLRDSSQDAASAALVDTWFATEYLAVGGREFMGGCDGTGIRFREMHWLGTTPPYFQLADPTAAVGDDHGGRASSIGPLLSYAGASPARGGARLSVEVGSGERVRVAVYDVAGRRVKVLLDALAPAERTIVAWDGRDADGRRVASGVYFARLFCGKPAKSLRIPLLW